MILNQQLIAIVDDDFLSSKVLGSALEKSGYATTRFQSGIEFLSSLSHNPPDLVLLDIMMPEINGFEVLKEIRSLYNPFELPVIMLTSKDLPSDIVRSFKEGASDFISKPAHPEVALARISTQLQLVTFYKHSLRKRELETLNAMIATYNHEINNPLVIALGNLKPDVSQMSDQKLRAAIGAVERISGIVKSIRDLMNSEPSYTEYSKNQKMIEIKKSS